MQVPTMRVRRIDDGMEVTINASDFDQALHEELKSEPPKDANKPVVAQEKPKPKPKPKPKAK